MNIQINFISPETRMIFLPAAENHTIVSSFLWTKHRNDGRTDLPWLFFVVRDFLVQMLQFYCFVESLQCKSQRLNQNRKITCCAHAIEHCCAQNLVTSMNALGALGFGIQYRFKAFCQLLGPIHYWSLALPARFHQNLPSYVRCMSGRRKLQSHVHHTYRSCGQTS